MPGVHAQAPTPVYSTDELPRRGHVDRVVGHYAFHFFATLLISCLEVGLNNNLDISERPIQFAIARNRAVRGMRERQPTFAAARRADRPNWRGDRQW